MSSFWGASVSAKEPLTVEPDPCGDLNITSATVQAGKPGKPVLLKICADDGDTFTLAALVPGAHDRVVAAPVTLTNVPAGASLHSLWTGWSV